MQRIQMMIVSISAVISAAAQAGEETVVDFSKLPVPVMTSIAERFGSIELLSANTEVELDGSAVHYIVGVEEPEWALGVEMDPALAQATRRSLFAKASSERILVAGYHFPFPGIGRIVEHGPSWRFVPMHTA